MKRTLVIAALVWSLLLAAVLQMPLKDWLWQHPWWHSFLVAVPGLLSAVIALLELQHSADANDLRRENNELREALDSERNQHLQDIAKHTKPQPTQAERTAARLRKHLGHSATVSEGSGVWPSPMEVVEVTEDNIATLFSPASTASTVAYAINVHCADLEIVEMASQLRLRVLKRYGDLMQFGNLTSWDDRHRATPPPAIPEKGQCAHFVVYTKPGSSETRELDIYPAKDGTNRFVLEARPSGEQFTGDNVDISKRFVTMQVEINAAGFIHSRSGSAGSKYPLYIHTH